MTKSKSLPGGAKDAKPEKTDKVMACDQFERCLQIKKKLYYLPNADHPVQAMVQKAIDESKHADLLRESEVDVRVMFVYPNVSNDSHATCTLASAHLQILCHLDYVVTIGGELWDKTDLDVLQVLLEHECNHMMCKTDKAGKLYYALRKHDLIDFLVIVEKYGLQWIKGIKKPKKKGA